MHVTQWKEPALNWNGTVSENGRASILEIRSDQFIPDFLQAMGDKDPASYFSKHRIDDDVDSSGFLKLYQPLHGCFYLVTASLVCRQLGLPDKTVDRTTGESVFYVIRRKAGNDEEAWIQTENGGHWQLLEDDDVFTLATGEERLAMHPVKICPQPTTPHSVFTDNVERDLYYGYIPTGNRDKYKDTVGRTTSTQTTSSELVNDFIDNAEAEHSAKKYSFRQDVFLRRVYLPWKSRIDQQPNVNNPFELSIAIGTTAQEEQLYLILELGDFFKNNLPTLWAALKAGNSNSLPTEMKALYDLLTTNLTVEMDSIQRSLRFVLLQYESYFPLVSGEGNLPSSINLDLNNFRFDNGSRNPLGNLTTLRDQIDDAVGEETAPIQVADDEDSELVNLITNQVQPKLAAGNEPLYYIRTVYEHDPDCPPLVSVLPTRPFLLTKFFEPDAPARLVRLEAPSIKPQDMRKFARGVGIEMSPELHKLASCFGGEDIQSVAESPGDCDNGGLNIQMICSFSIQIIFLVAFIVMFIFLISLNFIFGWLAYLRICLPIPTKSSS